MLHASRNIHRNGQQAAPSLQERFFCALKPSGEVFGEGRAGWCRRQQRDAPVTDL